MNAPMRYCAAPRCGQKVTHGYCVTHKAGRFPRQSRHARGYGKAWTQFRDRTFPDLLMEHGIIPRCGARLTGTPSPRSRCAQDGVQETQYLELHHEPPLQDWERQHPEIVCDPHRVEFLCRSDHTAETNRSRGLASHEQT